VTVGGEAGNTVSPGVLVDELDGFVKGVLSDNAHDGTEDLFIVASHTLFATINDGGTDPVTVGVTLNLGVTSIEEERSVLLTIGNESLDVSEEGFVVGGSDIVVEVTGSNGELGSLLNEVGNPFLGLTNKDDDGDSHASLSGGSETGTSNGVNGIFSIGVGEDNAMVLGSHVDLGSLSGGGGSGVDVLSGVVGSNKGDSLDERMVTDVIDGGLTSLNDVNNTIWDSGGLEHISDHRSSVRSSLGRLADECVSGSDGERVHPERDHGGEVVGSDSSTDSEGDSVRLDINTGGDVVHGLSHHEGVERASVLSNFISSEDITHTVSNGFTVLPADGLSEVLLVNLEEVLELEHVSNSVGDRDHRPGLEGILRNLNSLVEFGIGGLGNATKNSLGEGADLIDPLSGLGGDPFSTDVVLVLVDLTDSGLSGVVEGSSKVTSGDGLSKVKHSYKL
jgi:hypothetical protein